MHCPETPMSRPATAAPLAASLARCALRCALVGALLVAAAPAARAQEVFAPVEELAFDRPEAWALNWFASVTLLTRMAPAERREPWSVEAGLELSWVPHLDAEQRTVGFGGRKEEDLNQVPVFARGRLTVGLPAGFAATLGVVPPVEVSGVETEQVALAVDYPFARGERWGAAVRVYGQTGTSRGAFTCTREDAAHGDDFERNPFGCRAPSRDEATLRYAGLELSGSYRAASGLTPYLAAAIHHFDNEFQVDALTFDIRDRSLLRVDGSAWSLTAGASWPLAARTRLVGELFYSPLPVTRRAGRQETDALANARLGLAYRFR